jgi:hypothetical protein
LPHSQAATATSTGGSIFGADADLAIAAERDGTQVGAARPFAVTHLAARGVDLVGRERDVHAVDLRRLEQPARVVAQAEDRRPFGVA